MLNMNFNIIEKISRCFVILFYLNVLHILWQGIETVHLPFNVLENHIPQDTVLRRYADNNDTHGSCKPPYWMGYQNCQCWRKGYCQNKGSGKCTCCVEGIFEKPSNNCQVIIHCKANPCKNHSFCHTIYGSYFCNCFFPFHGRHCEKRLEGKRVKRMTKADVAYPVMNSFDRYLLLLFIVFDGEIGDDFTFTIKIGDLTYSGNDEFVDRNLSLETASKTTLPMPMSEVGANVIFIQYLYSSRNDKRNYTVETFIQLNNFGHEQFSANYTMFMMPQRENSCIASVEIDGCSHSNTDVIKVPRGKDYAIHGHIHVQCDVGEISFMWCICNLTTITPFPFTPGVKEDMNLTLSKKTENCRVCHDENQPQYKLPAFSMTYGIYGIMLKAQFDETDPDIPKINHPLDVCFLSIVADPIIAELAGGSAKIVDDGGKIILDASSSRDPNESDDDKSHLLFDWSCEPREHKLCSTVANAKGSNLTLNAVLGNYIFTVRVSVDKRKVPTIGKYPKEILPEPGIATQIITVIEPNSHESLTLLAITCVKNCGAQVSSKEVLYLIVTCTKYCVNADQEGFYNWAVGENEVNESDTQSGLHDDKLIINEKVLVPGMNYTITVTGGNEGKAYLNIEIRRSLEDIFKNKKCSIVPPSGISGFDVFNITCNYPEKIDGFPLRFELFQTPDLSKSQIEILITYSSKVKMENILLSAGSPERNYATELNIRIEDRFGEFTKQNIARVVVKPLTDAREFRNMSEAVRMLMSGETGRPSLNSYVTRGDMSGAVSLISALTIALDSSNMSDEEVWKIKKKFVAAIDQIPLYQDAPVRQVAALLHLVTGAGEKQPHIPPQSVHDTSEIVNKVSNQLVHEINDSYNEFEVSTEEIMNVSSMVLETVHTLLLSMERSMAILTEVATVYVETEEGEELPTYSEYYELDPDYYKTVANFREASKHIVLCLENMGKSLLHRLEKEEREKNVETKYISMWVKIDSPANFEGQYIGKEENGHGFRFSKEMAESLQNQTENIGIQITISAENPFVWDVLNKDVNTGIILLNLYNEALNETLETDVPVNVYVSVPDNTSSIQGNVTVPLKSINDNNVLEDCISVHRIEAKEGQTPFFKFEPLEDLSYKLQIVVTVGVRPLLEHFKEYSESVPHVVPPESTQDNLTVFVDGVSTQETSWFYLGILPHPDTLKNASLRLGKNTNFTMKYAFHVKIILCHLWNMTSMRWSSEYSKPGPETTPKMLHCISTHLSIFSGTLLASPNKLDMFENIPMLLYGSDNIMIPIFVASILFVYLTLLVWAKWKDNRDIDERIVTVLEDNYPGSSYTYLIGVYTGWKWSAGTTSNIGIQLIGDKSRSKAHILKDSTRSVHTRNSDNWFVIFSAKELGDLQFLHLWHDNSGHFPPWYCERVVVKDIQKDICWVFLVRRWLSVIHQNSSVFCSLPPASYSELHQKSFLFKDNLKLGLLEQHIWINIFMRHQWSTYTRVQRLTVTLCILLTTMLLSFFMIDIPSGDIDDMIDEPHFTFPGREFGLVLLAALLTIPLHFSLVLLFRKTAPREIRYNSNAKAFLVETTRKKGKSEWWTFFCSIFMLEPLIHPAKVKKGEIKIDLETLIKSQNLLYENSIKQDFKTSRYWFPSWVVFIAWILCILLIIVSVTLLIIFGLMFPEVKSEMWIAAVLMYIFFSILILQPLKVIVFSFILSYLCEKEPSNFQEVDIFFVKESKEQEELDKKLALKVRRLRKLQMYRPLKAADLLKLKHHERTRAKLADLFIDLCMFFVYIVTLYWLVLGTRDELAFYSTESLKKSIISDDFSGLKSGKQFITYMNKTLLPALHTEQWYNGEKINVTAVSDLYDTRLLGLVRLRQIRIRNVTCKLVPEMELFESSCNAEFSSAYEDTKNYDVGWKPFDKHSHRSNKRTKPWLYSTAWDTGTVPLEGKFSLYPGGGYICTLGRTLKNSLLIFNFLTENGWFDPLTRAVFMEFTLYNANRNIFNIVCLLVEIGATGAMNTITDIKSLKLLLRIEEFGPSVLSALILWILVLLMFTLRQFGRFGRVSVQAYFNSWWNIIDLIIIALAVCTIVFYWLRSEYVTHLVKKLEEADGNEFVNFIWAGYWQIQLRYFIAALVCLSTARLWKLLRFHYQFRNFERTLIRASNALLFLAFMMIIIITACACFSYLFISHSSAVFSTVLSSYAEMFSYGLGFSQLDDKEFFKQDPFIGYIFIIIFWIVYIVYLINMFITVLSFAYEDSQKEENIFQEDYTMLDYIKDELQYICKCRNRGRDSGRLKGKSLSVREKYPHYFHDSGDKIKNNTRNPSDFLNAGDIESALTQGDITPIHNLSEPQVSYFVQQKNVILPVNKLRLHTLYTQHMRLRAGADIAMEPTYAPAIAIPKPDEIRYDNVEKISPYRLEAMRNLALDAVQEEKTNLDLRLCAMTSIIQDHINVPKAEKDFFYRGLDCDKQKYVSDDKLIQMEKVVNKIGAKKYLSEMGDDNVEAEDDEIDDDDDDTDYVGHADVLALQMVKLHNIISNWKPEIKEIPDGEKGDDERSKTDEYEEQEISKTPVGYNGKYDEDNAKEESGVPSKIEDDQRKDNFDQEKLEKIKRTKPLEKQISDQTEPGERVGDKEKSKKRKRLPKQEHDAGSTVSKVGDLFDVQDVDGKLSEKTPNEGSPAKKMAMEPKAVSTGTKPKQLRKRMQEESKTSVNIITPLQGSFPKENGSDVIDHSKDADRTESEDNRNVPAEEGFITAKEAGLAYLGKNGAQFGDKTDKPVSSGKEDTIGKEVAVEPMEEKPFVAEKKGSLFLAKTDSEAPVIIIDQSDAKREQRKSPKRPKKIAKKKPLKEDDAFDDHILPTGPATTVISTPADTIVGEKLAEMPMKEKPVAAEKKGDIFLAKTGSEATGITIDQRDAKSDQRKSPKKSEKMPKKKPLKKDDAFDDYILPTSSPTVILPPASTSVVRGGQMLDRYEDQIKTMDDEKKGPKKKSGTEPKKKLLQKDHVVDVQEPSASIMQGASGVTAVPVATPMVAPSTGPYYERDFCALFPAIYPPSKSRGTDKNTLKKENSKPHTPKTSPEKTLPEQTGKTEHAVFPVESLMHQPFIRFQPGQLRTQNRLEPQSADIRMEVAESGSNSEQANSSSELEEERNFNNIASLEIPVNQPSSSVTQVLPNVDHEIFIPYQSESEDYFIDQASTYSTSSNETTFNPTTLSHFTDSSLSTSLQTRETNVSETLSSCLTSSTTCFSSNLLTERSITQISYEVDFNSNSSTTNSSLDETPPQRVQNFGSIFGQIGPGNINFGQEGYNLVPLDEYQAERESEHQEQQDTRILRQALFTRAERPLEEESKSRKENICSIPAQSLQRPPRHIPEMSPVLSERSFILPHQMSTDGLTRQDMRRNSGIYDGDSTVRNSQIPLIQSFDAINEETRVLRPREVTNSRGDTTVSDSSNTDVNVERSTNAINSLTGLGELRVTVHLNNGRFTVEGLQNQTETQEQRNYIGRNNETEANHQSEQNSQLREEIRDELGVSHNQHEFNRASASSRSSRSSRNRTFLRSSRPRQFCFMPEIFYPFQTPGFYFTQNSPYSGLPYFTAPMLFPSSHLQPAYFLGSRYWMQEDPRYMYFVPQGSGLQGWYMPFQRLGRRRHGGSSRMENDGILRDEANDLFQQGRHTPSGRSNRSTQAEYPIAHSDSFQQECHTPSRNSRNNTQTDSSDGQDSTDSRTEERGQFQRRWYASSSRVFHQQGSGRNRQRRRFRRQNI